jgi:hypothetical protein
LFGYPYPHGDGKEHGKTGPAMGPDKGEKCQPPPVRAMKAYIEYGINLRQGMFK